MFLAEIDRLLSPWSIVLLICLICYRNIRVPEQAAGVMESQQVKGVEGAGGRALAYLTAGEGAIVGPGVARVAALEPPTFPP